MRAFDIHGEPTTNPDAALHCDVCHRMLEMPMNDDNECVCGADLSLPDNLITGRTLKREREKIEQEMEEWTKLNTRGEP